MGHHCHCAALCSRTRRNEEPRARLMLQRLSVSSCRESAESQPRAKAEASTSIYVIWTMQRGQAKGGREKQCSQLRACHGTSSYKFCLLLAKDACGYPQRQDLPPGWGGVVGLAWGGLGRIRVEFSDQTLAKSYSLSSSSSRFLRQSETGFGFRRLRV